MTTTLSIDLNLTTAAESGLTSLPSLTPLTSPDTAVASGVVGRDVLDAPTAKSIVGGDVRDVRVVSDVRPAVALELVGRGVPDAPLAASVAAFRRAMAEPIAENAALGEAFAAAVAATAGEAAVGVEAAKNAKIAEIDFTQSRRGAEAGEEAVVASGLVGRDVLVSPERSEHREAMSLEACAPKT